VDLNVGFRRRPPRRHPVLDALALFFCAWLLGVAFTSFWAFAIGFAVMELLYVYGWRANERNL
jgi:hypothetical protein